MNSAYDCPDDYNKRGVETRSRGWSEATCCYEIPPSEYTCWYYGAKGRRESGDTSGTGQCPEDSRARNKWDDHMIGSGPEAFTESECCPRSCFSTGWRDSGDTSGTGQCPEDSSVRDQNDDHMRGQGAEAFTESECCRRNCW